MRKPFLFAAGKRDPAAGCVSGEAVRNVVACKKPLDPESQREFSQKSTRCERTQAGKPQLVMSSRLFVERVSEVRSIMLRREG